MIRHSYGYSLPHRGVTRNSGSEFDGYSRLDDGDLNTYWKSNPYLTKAFTGEEDNLHPQWIVIRLPAKEIVTAIRIAWAEPYARSYKVQYWLGKDDAMDDPETGEWKDFPSGDRSLPEREEPRHFSFLPACRHSVRARADDASLPIRAIPMAKRTLGTASDTQSRRSTSGRRSMANSMTCFITHQVRIRHSPTAHPLIPGIDRPTST